MRYEILIPDKSAEEAVVFDPTNVRWNEVFRRSTLSPVVFVVAPECSPQVHQILEDLGLPIATGGFMYLSSTSSAPLLDGLVISLTNDVMGTLPSRTASWAPGPCACCAICLASTLHRAG